jgi:hypothetical protein
MKTWNITPVEVKSCENCVWSAPINCRMCKADREENVLFLTKDQHRECHSYALTELAEILGTVSLYKLHPKKTLIQRILGR